MAHYGVLRDYRFPDAPDDIRGAKLYGAGGDKLGKIDDVIFDHETGNIHYAVIDTGGWLTTAKFIVPADRLRASTEHDGDYETNLTQHQVESFPPYHEKDLESEESWKKYEDKYRSKWETGPVMHRAETDRNITPTTEQLQGNRSSLSASEPALVADEDLDSDPNAEFDLEEEAERDADADLAAANADTGRTVAAGTDVVVIDNSASGIGGGWDTFQARLRERRKQAVAGCSTCAVGPQTVRGSESADTLKKAS